MISSKEMYSKWANWVDKNKGPKKSHFNFGNYEFIGEVIDYKFNGIIIDHYTEKQYKVTGLYPIINNGNLNDNSQEITINFKGLED